MQVDIDRLQRCEDSPTVIHACLATLLPKGSRLSEDDRSTLLEVALTKTENLVALLQEGAPRR